MIATDCQFPELQKNGLSQEMLDACLSPDLAQTMGLGGRVGLDGWAGLMVDSMAWFSR